MIFFGRGFGAAGIQINIANYRGAGPALNDLLGGHIDGMFDAMPVMAPQAKEGKVTPIAVTSAKRSAALPNVPTIAESGLSGFDYNLWVGVFAPAGTPPDIVDKINKDVARLLQSPEVKERFANLGAEPMPMTPAEFRNFVRAEIEESAKVIKAAGIKAQ